MKNAGGFLRKRPGKIHACSVSHHALLFTRLRFCKQEKIARSTGDSSINAVLAALPRTCTKAGYSSTYLSHQRTTTGRPKPRENPAVGSQAS